MRFVIAAIVVACVLAPTTAKAEDVLSDKGKISDLTPFQAKKFKVEFGSAKTAEVFIRLRDRKNSIVCLTVYDPAGNQVNTIPDNVVPRGAEALTVNIMEPKDGAYVIELLVTDTDGEGSYELKAEKVKAEKE